MLKKYSLRKIGITTLLLLLSFILYHYPENINKNINKEIYKVPVVSFSDFYLSMTEINCPSNMFQDKVERIIRYLIDEGILPNGTRLIDYALENGILNINFSNDILNVSSDMEEKMIEGLIYSLTSLDGVTKIHILIEGDELIELPFSKKKIDSYLDRSYGINKVYDITNLKNVTHITIYFHDSLNDYVPVSYYYNDSEDKVRMIIRELKNNSFLSGNLSSYLDYQVQLIDYEILEDKIVLNFNEFFNRFLSDGKIIEEVKYAIGYSVYDSLDISSIEFRINSLKIDELILAK